MAKKRIGVFLSGRGSNFKALLNAVEVGILSRIAEIVVVHSNVADAPGLDYATKSKIPTVILPHGDFPSRPAYETALIEALAPYKCDLICLAGYMRILSQVFLVQYGDRTINIHPSLLPKHPGLHTHRAVLRHLDRQHGATVHFVGTGLDSGPRIAQARVSVIAGDTEDDLSERVLEKEHQLYPKVVKWFCEDRLVMDDDHAVLDDVAIHFDDEYANEEEDDAKE